MGISLTDHFIFKILQNVIHILDISRIRGNFKIHSTSSGWRLENRNLEFLTKRIGTLQGLEQSMMTFFFHQLSFPLLVFVLYFSNKEVSLYVWVDLKLKVFRLTLLPVAIECFAHQNSTANLINCLYLELPGNFIWINISRSEGDIYGLMHGNYKVWGLLPCV